MIYIHRFFEIIGVITVVALGVFNVLRYLERGKQKKVS